MIFKKLRKTSREWSQYHLQEHASSNLTFHWALLLKGYHLLVAPQNPKYNGSFLPWWAAKESQVCSEAAFVYVTVYYLLFPTVLRIASCLGGVAFSLRFQMFYVTWGLSATQDCLISTPSSLPAFQSQAENLVEDMVSLALLSPF